MWNYYSVHYFKQNKNASLFMMAIAFLTSALMTFFSVFYYNLWQDQIYKLSVTRGLDPSQAAQVLTSDYRALLVSYLLILIAISCALIFMLHNAYEVTMNSRLHQLGILKSTGASPRQIRTVLIQECVILSLLPTLFGAPAGVMISWLFIRYFIIAGQSFRTYDVWFRLSFWPVAVPLLFTFFTVTVSAWIPARKLARLSPLDAIRQGVTMPVKKMKPYRLFSSLFGLSAELAAKSIYARKKAFRTSMLSITCSILAFISFLNLEVISGLSVEDTYFNRYRNVWDFGIELNPVSDQTRSQLTASIRQLDGVTSCIQYRRTLASTSVSRDCLSRQAAQDASFSNEGASNNQAENMAKLSVPILILDNESFSQYQTGNPEQIVNPDSGIIAVNQYWDNQTSRRMSPVSLFKTDAPLTLELYSSDGKTPVTVKTENFSSKLPKLTEEFPQGSLPLILSEACYSKIADLFPADTDYFLIKTLDETSHPALKSQINSLCSSLSGFQLESRVEKETSNLAIRKQLRIAMGMIALLLSLIGLSNVFSATLGHIQQRKREFARYSALGFSPKNIRQILIYEALILLIRPVIISILLNIPLVIWALHLAHIPARRYLACAPLLPAAALIAIMGSMIALAYFLGIRAIFRGDLTEVLKDDSLV